MAEEIKNLDWLGEEIWLPESEDKFAQLLSEAADNNKITPEERAKVDGKFILGIMEGCFFVTNGFSENKRHYSLELWENAIKSQFVSEKLSSTTFFGTLGHEDKEIDEKDIENGKHSINTYKLWIDESTGLGMGRAYILNTKAGWNLFAAMKSGSKFKMSSRAKGSFLEGAFKVDALGVKQPVVDPKTFKLLSFDVVFNPGFKQTSAILKENLKLSGDGSSNMTEELSKLLLEKEKAISDKNALLAENTVLKSELESKRSELSSLEANKSATSFVNNISESVLNIVSNFNKEDWNLLLDTKLKTIGESKLISFNKNNYHYDSLFIPVELPLVTEGKLKSIILGSKFFENKPVEVAVVSKNVDNSFGTSGLVICWQAGSRPSNIFENAKTFISTSGLFEKDEEDKKDKEPDNDSDDCEKTDMDKDDKEELKEWRKIAEDASPSEFCDEMNATFNNLKTIKQIFEEIYVPEAVELPLIDKIKLIAEEYEQVNALGGLTVFAEALKDSKQVNEAVDEFNTTSTDISLEITEEIENAKKIYQHIKENYGSLQAIDEEITEARNFKQSFTEKYGSIEAIDEQLMTAVKVYSYISEKYGTLAKVDLALKFAEKLLEKKEAEKTDADVTVDKDADMDAKKDKDAEKPAKEEKYDIDKDLEEKAKSIAESLGDKMSINEVYNVLVDYKGNINEATERVFKFMKPSAPATSKVQKQEQNINESADPIADKMKASHSTRTGSLLGSYYEQYAQVKR